MAAIATALRRFISGVTRVFHGTRATFKVMVTRWKSAVATLGKKVRSLADKFASLRTTKRVSATGEESMMLGNIEGKEFTRMLRTARSASAFEAATLTKLSPAARSAFRHLDDIAELHFPDVSIMKRDEYLKHWRDVLISNKTINEADRIMDAAVLEKLIRADAATLKRTNSLLDQIARHKKLVFLGGAITVASIVGIPMLCRFLSRYAKNHSGCFMYTRDLTNGVRKCRILGCSCPISLDGDYDEVTREANDETIFARECYEADLWEKMHIVNNECSRERSNDEVARTEPFCVHCNWDETDPTSVDYVDKDKLQDGAYVRCETFDSLDALNEVVGAMVGNVFGLSKELVNIAQENLASSTKALPWIISGVAIFAIVIVVIFIWRFLSSGSNHFGGLNKFSPLLSVV